jgi:hypothetical protein
VKYQQHCAAPTTISNGDTIQAHYTLKGRMKGTSDWACTAVGTQFVCSGIIRLPKGDLYAASGPIDQDQPAAVLGEPGPIAAPAESSPSAKARPAR